MSDDHVQESHERFRQRVLEEQGRGRRTILLEDMLPRLPRRRSRYQEQVARAIIRPIGDNSIPTTNAIASTSHTITTAHTISNATLDDNIPTTSSHVANIINSTDNTIHGDDTDVLGLPITQGSLPNYEQWFAPIAAVNPTVVIPPTPAIAQLHQGDIISLSSGSSDINYVLDGIPTPPRHVDILEYHMEENSNESAEQHQLLRDQLDAGPQIDENANRSADASVSSDNANRSADAPVSPIAFNPNSDEETPTTSPRIIAPEERYEPDQELADEETISVISTDIVLSTPNSVVITDCSSSSPSQKLPNSPSTSSNKPTPKKLFISTEVSERERRVFGNLKMVEGIARYCYVIEASPPRAITTQGDCSIRLVPNEESPKRKLHQGSENIIPQICNNDVRPGSPTISEVLHGLDLPPVNLSIPSSTSAESVPPQLQPVPTQDVINDATKSFDTMSISENKNSGQQKTTVSPNSSSSLSTATSTSTSLPRTSNTPTSTATTVLIVPPTEPEVAVPTVPAIIVLPPTEAALEHLASNENRAQDVERWVLGQNYRPVVPIPNNITTNVCRPTPPQNASQRQPDNNNNVCRSTPTQNIHHHQTNFNRLPAVRSLPHPVRGNHHLQPGVMRPSTNFANVHTSNNDTGYTDQHGFLIINDLRYNMEVNRVLRREMAQLIPLIQSSINLRQDERRNEVFALPGIGVFRLQVRNPRKIILKAVKREGGAV